MRPEKFRRAVAEINGTIVMHPRFEHAYKGILRIIDTARYADIPYGATVVAPPGCGKTALIKVIARAIPSTSLLGDDLRSVVVSAEANATHGHFISQLLQQLGYPPTIRASALYDQTPIISAALRERGARVLFLDEFQHVCRGKRVLSAASITDWIKRLADDAGVVVVLLGTLDLKPLIELNDQLASRAPARFELRPFERNEEWRGVLRQLSESVESFDLSATFESLHKPLHAACRGTLRPLKQILIASVGAAVEAGKDAVDAVALAAGYTHVFGADSHYANPFLET